MRETPLVRRHAARRAEYGDGDRVQECIVGTRRGRDGAAGVQAAEAYDGRKGDLRSTAAGAC